VVAGKIVKSRVHPLEDIQRTVRVLLQAGADPNRLRYDFGSPLISAAGDGNLPILKMLMKAGGDPNRQDALGETALS
jgi:cytohesin